MTDTTKPQPGRTLDVLMARAMGWAVYDATTVSDWEDNLSYPCMHVGKHPDDYMVSYSFGAKEGHWVLWRPSTNLLHAFEVVHEGWRWNTIESETGVVVQLTGDNWQTVISANVLWGEAPDKPAAYALARCRCVAAWWEANRGE